MTQYKSRRVAKAKERQELYNTLTTEQKIADLNARLGEGVGATKQRARLAARLEKEKAQASKKDKKDAQ